MMVTLPSYSKKYTPYPSRIGALIPVNETDTYLRTEPLDSRTMISAGSTTS